MELKWTVAKDDKGKFVRRHAAEGDVNHLDHVDVVWTCDGGFPADTILVPVSHPPDIQYEARVVGEARKEIIDQLSVAPSVSDATIARMLDEKMPFLAESLGLMHKEAKAAKPLKTK